MNVLWDSDTGSVTFIASDASGPVNLSATTARVLKVKHRASGTLTTLAETSNDLPNGKVVCAGAALDAGEYDVILRCTDPTKTQTYPTADVGAARLVVKPDMDAA